MKLADAMKECRRIDQEMLDHSVTAERCGQTYSAQMQLYSIACAGTDEKEIEELRLKCISNIEMLLDAGAAIGRLTRERNAVARSVEY